MGSILTRYLSVIPTVQSANIKRRVYEDAIARGSTDAQARVDYTERIAEIVGQPAPNLFKGYITKPGKRVYSEVFEKIFTDISDDLTVLFAEYDLLYGAGVVQTQVYKNEIVDKLARAVKEAKTEVRRVKSLHKTFANESNSLSEDFDQGDANRLDLTDPLLGSMIRDRFTGLIPMPHEHLIVDIGSGSLCLPISNKRVASYHPRNNRGGEERAQGMSPFLMGTTSSDSDWDERLNSLEDINDIKDPNPGSFWEHCVYKESESNSQVYLSLSLQIGGSGSNINSVFIDASADQIVSVRGAKLDGTYVDLVSTGQEYKMERLGVIIRFDEISIKRIDIVFSQKEYEEIIEQGVRLYKYPFKINYIEASMCSFRDTGHYVSDSLKGANQSIFQLNAISTDKNTGIIEYTLHYRDYLNADTVGLSKSIPILPTGEIESKELLDVLADKTAFLRFFVDTLVDEDGNHQFDATMKIYRNGVELLRNVDYSVYNPIGENEIRYEDRTMILLSDHVDVNAEFVAEYIPYWTSGFADPNYTSTSGDVYFRRNNTIEILRGIESRAVRSECNLGIVIRATDDKRRGPRVMEYTLSVGERFSQ